MSCRTIGDDDYDEKRHGNVSRGWHVESRASRTRDVQSILQRFAFSTLVTANNIMLF